MRPLLGLANPGEGDETIGGRAEREYPLPDDLTGGPEKPELNAEQAGAPDELESLAEENNGYVQISDDIAAVIERAAGQAADFESFRAELQKLVTGWPPDKTAECIAVAAFKARALGDAEFDKGE
jgi:hypothetical protein